MFVTEFVWRQSSCDCVKMSEVQMLSLLVKQRLTAAAEEISGLFERTIAEYEEELCRSQEENERQRKLLDAVLQPRVQLHRAGWFWLVLLTAASAAVCTDVTAAAGTTAGRLYSQLYGNLTALTSVCVCVCVCVCVRARCL